MFPKRNPDKSTGPVRAAAREADHERERVVSGNDARQGSSRQMNLRVLVVSLAILSAVGLALTAAYWGTAVEDHAIPSGPAQSSEANKAMDGSTPAPDAAPTTKSPGSQ